MRKTWFVSAAIILLMLASATAQTKKITCAADAYPPFVDMDNPTQGLSLEIIRAAMATQGYAVDMQSQPWARAQAAVIKGEIDILPDVWMSEERKKDMLFSDAYTSNDVEIHQEKGRQL